MAVWSSITTSKMEYTRIDADYYHPDYLSEMVLWRELKEKNNVSKLRHLIRVPVSTGRTPSSRIIKDGELCIPFIKTDNLREGSVDFNNSDFLPARVLSNNDYIPKDSVVITIIGATPEIVGRAAIVRPEDPDCVTNQNVAVVCTNEKCDSYYLTAFFQTKLGRDQLWRHSRRTEQVNPNCREVERVLVPLLTNGQQKEIGDLVRASFQSSDHSIDLYKQAQHTLESELGLDKLKFKKPVGYTARFSDTITNGRFDADYYHPQFAAIQQTVKNYSNGYEPLISIATALKPNIDPAKTPNQRYNYIELSNINPTLGTVDGFGSMLGKDLPSRARRQVINGDVIASAVVGSVDKAAVIDAAQSVFMASTGFFHFRPISVSSEYLLILVKSKCVCMQFQQQSTGGILSAVPDSRLRNIIVPKLPDKLQQKIRDLVLRSHSAKKKSQELLGQAKARVEQLIEEAAAR